MNHYFSDHILYIPVLTWILSVILKWIFLIIKKKFTVSWALWSGWMPSVHSALVTSITTAIWIKYWIFSELFSACLVFSMIIIYDAINVRFEAWLHAKTLNELTWKQYNFNESIWHLPNEAFAWSIIWIVFAFFLMMI
ncbi:MAG: hypothetical protein ACD_3C00013G0008 [uncultured bacterium (gcode 4)]|uniref:Acid phosphatase/vanadium-dependent haloperoxidase related protein n=1 Tax=uncultured bacterium (gcode 4) TaxID=1234023 RepID=K2GZ73_9BACT|nr:MAG: hypothetical protein ACD_3C00013G0008 [uncultured bacterium (gcode 4)]